MRAFKTDMEVIINTIDTEKLPGYKRLLTEEYWKISDDQFPGIIEEVLDDVKNGSLKLIEIVKLFAYYSYFIRRGLIDYDMKTIKATFIEGMDLASESSEYCDNLDEELSRIGIDVGDDMEEIIKHFHELNAKLEDKMYREKAEEIFKCIPMKMEKFYDRFDKECMNIPIFKYQEPYQIFQRLLYASNEDIVIIKEKLIKRVETYRKEIEPEKENMKALKKLIDEYTEEKENSIKIVMLKEFSRDLDYILEKYEAKNENQNAENK